MQTSSSGGSGLLNRDAAQALADRVLKLATGADQARINITSEWSGNTRFADASITTSGHDAIPGRRVDAAGRVDAE